MATFTFKFRRGPASEWTADNPVLAAGEPGVELDTGKVKIGNGVQTWTNLPYFLDEDLVTALIQGMIEDAVLNGVPGVPGKSAYQVAVDNGFVGTETQWLASLVGPQGATGAQGIQGPQGEQGIQGPAGTAGAQGIQGIPGVQGETGPQGPAGEQGPQGAQGPQGIAGTDGDDGAPGLSAYQIAVNNGFVGTESQWLASLVGPEGDPGAPGADGDDGAAGLSAYQIAVNNGFVGTESQWLASLEGPAGQDGVDGSNGVGLPVGGTTGQIAAKNSNTDYDVEWIDPPSGGGSSVNFETKRITSGNVAGTNTAGAWVVCANSSPENIAITIAAAVGDLIEVTPDFMVNPGTIKLDWAVIVSGSPVWYDSSKSSTPNVEGKSSYYSDQSFIRPTAPTKFVVTAPMLSGGTVTVALMRRGTSATGLIYADTNYSFNIDAVNHGPAT